MIVKVVEYNNAWPSMFLSEASRIKKIIGDNLIQIYHIGSTAVSGLPAKPIIDIMPVVKDIEAVDTLKTAFEDLGYEYMGEFGIPGRRYMRKGGDNRTHQIHSFQYDNSNDILRHLAFRDYLRVNPDAAELYAKKKIEMAKNHPFDIEAYNVGKAEIVKQIEREALECYHIYNGQLNHFVIN